MFKSLASLLVIIFFCKIACAQSTINIRGKITDDHDRPIAGATVRVLNADVVVVADSAGSYTIGSLRTGDYQLLISAINFASATLQVHLLSGNATSQDIRLTPAIRQLDELYVTAEKKDALPQDLPLSLSTISSKQVTDYRLWNSKDITGIVPNLYSADPGDGRNATGIRGIATTSYDPAVATYIDGVNQYSLDTYIPQLLDVERIEVLRGPQGTLYGRNAMGGVINIITRQPTNNTSGFVELTRGNYDQQRYTAGFRTPLIKNKLFLGAAGLFDSRNGYYTNTFNNSSYDKQHSFTGNYYLKYLASQAWQMTLNFKHNENRNHGPFPLVAGDAFTHPFVLDQNAITTMIDNTVNASLAISYSGPAFNFTSQTAFQKNYRYYQQPIDGDFSPLDAVTIINNYGKSYNYVSVWTQEFRFTSPASTTSPFNWTTGAYLFTNHSPVKQATHYGPDAGVIGSPVTDLSTIATTQSHNSGIAWYGQAGYYFTHQLELTLGLRYDYEYQKEDVFGQLQNDGQPAITTQPDTAGKTSYHALSPKAVLNYHLSGQAMVYGSYARGFRTGGLTGLSSDATQPALYGFKPEYSDNFEVGSKTTFLRRRLQLNLALFYLNVTDAQVPTLVLPQAITITRNTGRLTSKGFEAELAAKPFQGLELNYAVGYTDAKYKKLDYAENGSVVDLSGKHQLFTPDWTSMLAAQYSYAVDAVKGSALVVRGEWRYLGNTWFDLANTIRQSSYSIFNLRAGIENKNFSLFFWERNLGNKRYIAYAYDFGAIHLGDPRTYGVTLSTRF